MRAKKVTHPKLAVMFQVIDHFVKYHGATLNLANTQRRVIKGERSVRIVTEAVINSPNRKQRRAIKFGVKIGKNRTTAHSLATGSLKRARVSLI